MEKSKIFHQNQDVYKILKMKKLLNNSRDFWIRVKGKFQDLSFTQLASLAMLASLAALFINTWVVVLKVRLSVGSLDHLLRASLSSCKSSLPCVARFSSVYGARFARVARFARGVFINTWVVVLKVRLIKEVQIISCLLLYRVGSLVFLV